MKAKIQLLRDHNAWRRGNDDFTMADPRELGIAIESVCKQAERYENLLTLDIADIADLMRRAKLSGVRFSVLLDEIIYERKPNKSWRFCCNERTKFK